MEEIEGRRGRGGDGGINLNGMPLVLHILYSLYEDLSAAAAAVFIF